MDNKDLSKNVSLEGRQEGEKFAHVKDTLYLCIRFKGRRTIVRSAPNERSMTHEPRGLLTNPIINLFARPAGTLA